MVMELNRRVPKMSDAAKSLDLALEAEAKRRGMSKQELAREMAKQPPAPLVHVKMPPAMKAGLEAEAERTGDTIQGVIRGAIGERLAKAPTKHVRYAKG